MTINGKKYNEIVIQSNHAATKKSLNPTEGKLSRLKTKKRILAVVIIAKTMPSRANNIFIVEDFDRDLSIDYFKIRKYSF